MLAHFIEPKPFPCGYFQDRSSLFEEYLLEDISEVEFEYMLAHGMRHFGEYFFRPSCQKCHECVPIRLRVAEFNMNRSQKRALKKCANVKVKLGNPAYSDKKFKLYLDHKIRFQTLKDDVEDERNFKLSFYAGTPYGIEFEYYLDGSLIGVALGDVTQKAFSSIYTFYNPDLSDLSLGTFSVLKQIEYARLRGIAFLYLGYYITKNHSLAYKANFRPNELYIDQEWRPFRNVVGDVLIPEEKILWANMDTLVKATSKPKY